MDALLLFLERRLISKHSCTPPTAAEYTPSEVVVAPLDGSRDVLVNFGDGRPVVTLVGDLALNPDHRPTEEYGNPTGTFFG